MSALLNNLQSTAGLGESGYSILKLCFGDTDLDLFKVHLDKKDGKRVVYSEKVKKFALTLFSYSPKSYTYVRSIFSLPHPRTLTKWLAVINGNPGITREAVICIQKKTIWVK